MRAIHFSRHAEQLRLRLSFGEDGAPLGSWGGLGDLQSLCATLASMGGEDVGKLSRLLAATRQAAGFSPAQSRRLAAECFALRAEIVASGEGYARPAVAQGADDKSLPFLLKKAAPLTEAEQAMVWERLVGLKDCPRLIARLAKMGLAPNAAGPSGVSALAVASVKSVANITALIAAGAWPDGLPTDPKSPLLLAFEKASGPGVRALLDGGADPILSRLPTDLPKVVAAARHRASVALFGKAREERDPLHALALALSERVALSQLAKEGAPESAPAKSPRL